MIIENKFSITDFAVSPEIKLTSNSAITQITSPAPVPTPIPMYNNYMIKPKFKFGEDNDGFYCKCQCFTIPYCPCFNNNTCKNYCSNTCFGNNKINHCPCNANSYSHSNYHCDDTFAKENDCTQFNILDNKELILALILACSIK